jgi:hypothetical protein
MASTFNFVEGFAVLAALFEWLTPFEGFSLRRKIMRLYNGG